MKHRIQQGTSAAPRYPKPGLYLAGEISRKIGNEKAAIKYFKKMPGKPPSSRWPGTLSGTQTDPGNNPPFAAGTDKKRAVPSRNSLLSAVDD